FREKHASDLKKLEPIVINNIKELGKNDYFYFLNPNQSEQTIRIPRLMDGKKNPNVKEKGNTTQVVYTYADSNFTTQVFLYDAGSKKKLIKRNKIDIDEVDTANFADTKKRKINSDEIVKEIFEKTRKFNRNATVTETETSEATKK